MSHLLLRFDEAQYHALINLAYRYMHYELCKKYQARGDLRRPAAPPLSAAKAEQLRCAVDTARRKLKQDEKLAARRKRVSTFAANAGPADAHEFTADERTNAFEVARKARHKATRYLLTSRPALAGGEKSPQYRSPSADAYWELRWRQFSTGETARAWWRYALACFRVDRTERRGYLMSWSYFASKRKQRRLYATTIAH